MQQSVKLPSSRFRRFLCFFRIRQLLLLVLGLISLIALSAIIWNTLYVNEQYLHAKRMETSNAISQKALGLNALLARERGWTAVLLAKLPSAKKDLTHLADLRQQSDHGIHTLRFTLDSYSGQQPVTYLQQYLREVTTKLSENRQKADKVLNNQGTDLNHHIWMATMNQLIADVANISHLITAPIHEEEHAERYGISVKNAFFTLSENAGRERALIGVVLSQQRSFTQQEIRLLDKFLNTSQLIDDRLIKLLSRFPKTSEILTAYESYLSLYKQKYLNQRSELIKLSQNKQSYPINATEWFQYATEAIDAILALSEAINSHLNDDIDVIKTDAKQTVYALIGTFILVVVIFVITFSMTYRRILLPLRELEHSANTIAKGDLSQPINVLTKDEFGDVAEAFEVMRDYLFYDREQREKAEHELTKLSTAIEQSVSSVVITDSDGTTEYVNPQFYKTTGYSAKEIIGHKFNRLRSGRNSRATYQDLWHTINRGEVWQGELCNKKKNGQFYWDLVSISPVRNKDGEISHFISVQHDITKRKALEEQLSFMAYHDELTQLPNRSLLNDRFLQLTKQAKRSQSKIALLLIDLDRFKIINDSLGHSVGDQLLVEVSLKLNQVSRESDSIARYGGDEFVILAREFTEIDVITHLSDRLLEVFANPFAVEQHQLYVSASIGISIWPDDGKDMDTLLKQADSAMYLAKEKGRDQFQFYTKELNQKINERLRLENDLRQAIVDNHLELYYQPQVYPGSRKIVGAEALIRWQHAELGFVSPLKFIPLAEDTNLINPIGNWVLATACAQAVKWQQFNNSGFTMAVNVSAKQLEHNDFITSLNNVLKHTGLKPELLEVEITESSVMDDPDKMLEVLKAIKQLGVKLALDDFGTGYSSLSYLRRFPFDKLKIDRSFIKEVTSNNVDATIAQSIVNMAHSLEMVVIAEGVENEVQSEYMQRCRCDEIQGYLISRPIPAADFERLCLSWDKTNLG